MPPAPTARALREPTRTLGAFHRQPLPPTLGVGPASAFSPCARPSRFLRSPRIALLPPTALTGSTPAAQAHHKLAKPAARRALSLAPCSRTRSSPDSSRSSTRSARSRCRSGTRRFAMGTSSGSPTMTSSRRCSRLCRPTSRPPSSPRPPIPPSAPPRAPPLGAPSGVAWPSLPTPRNVAHAPAPLHRTLAIKLPFLVMIIKNVRRALPRAPTTQRAPAGREHARAARKHAATAPHPPPPSTAFADEEVLLIRGAGAR